MMQSLRIRLLILLGLAILTAAAILFATSFRAAMQEANKLSDYHMQQMALSLKDNRYDEGIDWYALPDDKADTFDFVIQFLSSDGMRVYQPRPYTVLPEIGDLGYSTVTLENGDWRLYVVQSQTRTVQIAQKMEIRRNRAASLALHAVWPVVPVSILLFLAAWLVISSALSPLNRIAGDLARRTANSLAPVSTIGVPREVSLLVNELNSMIVRLAQTLNLQQRFLADATHELRSPLTALKLQLHTLARARDDGERSHAITRLEGGVDRASRLVEQLLALSRQDPQSRQFIPTDVSLLACIESAANDVASLAASKNISLKYGELADVEIAGDADDLLILFRNLLDNAVRYTPEHGWVRIGVSKVETSVVVTIVDTGNGIPQADHARVFDRFFRMPGTSPTGSGLGLAIVKAIAERHQATVELANADTGGLTVKLAFPIPVGHTALPALTILPNPIQQADTHINCA